MVRARGGAIAKKRGSEFEAWVERNLTDAAGLVAYWHHNQPTYVRGTPVAPGIADYSGALRGGIELAIEAKSRDSRRFYRDEISKLQGEHLDSVTRAGGVALLAMQFRDEARGLRANFVVEWRHVPWERAETALSLSRDVLAGHEATSAPHILDPFVILCEQCGMAWPRSRADRQLVGCFSPDAHRRGALALPPHTGNRDEDATEATTVGEADRAGGARPRGDRGADEEVTGDPRRNP